MRNKTLMCPWLCAFFIDKKDVESRCSIHHVYNLRQFVAKYGKFFSRFPSIGHVNNIPTMQFFIGISRNSQSKSYILSLTECVWDFQKRCIVGYSPTCPTHRLVHHSPSVTLAVVALQRINTSRVTITPSYTEITLQHVWTSLVRECSILSQLSGVTWVDKWLSNVLW